MDSFDGKTPAGHLLSTKFEKDPIECISSALPYICYGLAMHRQTQNRKDGRSKASQDPVDNLMDKKPLVELPLSQRLHSSGGVNTNKKVEKAFSVVKPKFPKAITASAASKPSRLELGAAATKYKMNPLADRKLSKNQEKQKVAGRSLLAMKRQPISLAEKKSTRGGPPVRKLRSQTDAAKKPAKKPAKKTAKQRLIDISVAHPRQKLVARGKKQTSKGTKTKHETKQK